MRTFKDTRGKSWFNVFDNMNGQVDITVSYPGTIRGFHHHKIQTEWWFVIQGEYKFVFKKKGEPKEIKYLSPGEVAKIEPNTWHGYQVLGNQTGIIIEFASEKFNVKKPDDQRKPYNAFDDWKKEKK